MLMSKTIFKGLIASLALAVLFLNQAHAAGGATTQPYVVVVGIDQYKDAQILPRKHAEADAKLLFDVFTNPDYIGANADHIQLLLGKEDAKRKSQPATRENILKSLNWLVDNAGKDDTVIFVYIGQALPWASAPATSPPTRRLRTGPRMP